MSINSHPDADRTVDARVVKLHEPFTLSCVLTVDIEDTKSGAAESNYRAILKLYDRRFAAQLRKDERIDPWTEATECDLHTLVGRGQAAEFVRRLREEEDFEVSSRKPTRYRGSPGLSLVSSRLQMCKSVWKAKSTSPPQEPDEGWSAAENEAYLHNLCNDLYATEVQAYTVLGDLQGKQIPKLYSSATVPLGCSSQRVKSNHEAQAQGFFTIKGLLLEHVPGPTMTEMMNTIPRHSWQQVVDQAVHIVHLYSQLHVLNKDVRCSNFVVNETVPDGHEHRVVMLDFALCEFKSPNQSEHDWGRAKWTQDEEGAIGAVMKTKLAEYGFELNYTPSHAWIAYAEREHEGEAP